MFKVNDLSSTLNKVNNFIAELKSGVKKHKQKIKSIEEKINSMYSTRDSLANEVFQAEQLIGTLSGNNN